MGTIQLWVDLWGIYNYCAGICNQGVTMQKHAAQVVKPGRDSITG